MNEIKVVLIGNSGVGKTCIAKHAISGEFDENSAPTLGASYVSKTIFINNLTIELQIWDTAGQERYRGMAPLYYRGAKIVFLVFSLIDRSSYDSIDDWFVSYSSFVDKDAILFLVGNKNDLTDGIFIKQQQAMEKAKSIGARQYFEVSAKTGYGLEEIFTVAGKMFLENHDNLNSNPQINLSINTPENKKECC